LQETRLEPSLDASWLIQATTTDGFNYTVVSRSLDYYFGSVLQTRFFFFGDQKIYDSRTGTVISDFVNVLKTNSKPTFKLASRRRHTTKNYWPTGGKRRLCR
jgi:hypothetical protein